MALDALDAPVVMQACSKYGMILVVTKLGYLLVYEVSTGLLVHKEQFTTNTVFVSQTIRETNGMVAIDGEGLVWLLNINETQLLEIIK